MTVDQPAVGHPALDPRAHRDLAAARTLAAGCTACDLSARATATVFGEGDRSARLMLVGEQPGDHEDRTGHPFVGPAGRVLDEALAAAGIDRETVFVTNVVKHFKWRPSGKRRLHERPNAAEIRACRPWLDIETEIIRPDLLVALGATAAQALAGPAFRITERRGEVVQLDGDRPPMLATYHPSAILRARTSVDRDQMLAALVADLERAAAMTAGR